MFYWPLCLTCCSSYSSVKLFDFIGSYFVRDVVSFIAFLLIVSVLIMTLFQKAHVQQFLATEDSLNKAAEARDSSQKLLKVLQGDADAISPHSVVGKSQNVGSLRQLEVALPIHVLESF